MAEQTTISKKNLKKIWVPLMASKEFTNVELGESHVYDVSQLVGKVIDANLSMLTGDPKKQNFKVIFKVKEIKENKGATEIMGYEIVKAYSRRLTKMSKGKIDETKNLKTKDNVKVILKILALSKHKPQNAVLTAVRKKLDEDVKEFVKNSNYQELIDAIISFRLQKDLQKDLKKIYPLSYLVVKTFKKLE
ncbi:MAG: hypothetical protein WC413_03415 [Candidatus Nanoarchaeia archaeon]